MNKLVLLALAAFIFQAAPALADRSDNKGAKMFEKQDSNSDGRISEAEFLANPKQKFAKIDANRDGFISQEEAKAAKSDSRGDRKGGRRNR